jgi:hypothetical protein
MLEAGSADIFRADEVHEGTSANRSEKNNVVPLR